MTYIQKQLPHITDKQLEVLKLLIKFRFINTNHFQKIFNHKDPHRIKEWLKDLVDKKCIYTNYSKNTFISKPATYCLDLKGRAILKKEGYDPRVLGRIYRDKNQDEEFIQKRFYLVDLYIYFLGLQKENNKLKFYTDSDLLDYDYLPQKLLDAYISVKGKSELKRYFATFVVPGRKNRDYRNLIKAYLYYYSTRKWEENTNNSSFPGVLLIFQKERTKMHIFHYSKAILKDKFPLFLTTKSRVQSNSSKETIWLKVE